jgi:hypothetical protein
VVGEPPNGFYWIADLLGPEIEIFENEDSDGGIFLPLSTPLTDPCAVPKIQRLINRCKGRGDPRKEVSASGVTTRRKQQHQKQRRIMSRNELSPPNLPMDIQELILDELTANASPSDTANAVEAFYWYLPNKCWQRRLPLDMLVELDGVLSDADFDWRRFFIEFSRLAASGSQALASRKRIFAVLRVIRDEFFSAA